MVAMLTMIAREDVEYLYVRRGQKRGKKYVYTPKAIAYHHTSGSTGNFGRELIKKKGCTVVGIDIFDDDLKLASDNLNKVYKRNIETDEINDLGSFDVIIMADVIEHLIDPTKALIKIKKQLNKNGIFIFSVPNMANIGVRLELLRGRFSYTSYGLLDQTHIHYYDRIQLETVLKNAGFSVEAYKNTVRDIPKVVMNDHLKLLGLEATEKFFDHSSHEDAITFQFIGVATVSKKKHRSITLGAPHDFMSQKFDKITTESEYLKSLLETTQDQIKTTNEELLFTRKELNDIKSSRGWKLLMKIHSIIAKIKLRSFS